MNTYELEEVLKKTTKILAGEEIEVIMEGFQPRVEYNPKTKKPTRIYIPSLPEETPESLVRAIHGFIDHECSHIMFSDADDICDSTKSKLWHYIHNCIEDPRVNKAMGNYYLGSGKNIKAGYNYLFNEPNADGSPSAYDKSYVDALDFTDEKAMAEQQMRYSSLWFAHQMGDTLSGDKYKELDLDRLYGPLEAKMDKRWLDQLKRVNNPNDVKNCTEYFEGFFSKEAMDNKGGKGDEDGEDESGKPGAGAVEDDVPDTLEDELAKKIQKQIEYGLIESKVGFYWTNRWDVKINKNDIVKSIESTRRTTDIVAFEEEVKSVTNYLNKDLRRLLEERRRRYYIGGYKSGKLNTKSLFSVKLGNDRVFKKRNEVRDINAAVSLLIDMSGSMGGDKIKVAMQSAYAFAMVLDQVGVSYEVYGFNTQNPSPQMRTEWEKLKATLDKDTEYRVVNEFCPEHFYAFKEYHESFDYTSKKGMALAGNGWVRMVQNEDSKHVKLALERLSVRPERVKALFVFSDGQPAFPTAYPANGPNNLKYYANNAKSKYGVDIFSIGIQCNSVERFYKSYKVVNKVNELPQALFEFLKKVI